MLHFRTSKAELHRIISLTQNVVSKKGTMPIMANFLLSGQIASEKSSSEPSNSLKIFASDLDVTSMALLPCDIVSEGRACVKASMLADVVKELPDGIIDIKVDEQQRMEITAGGSQLKILGISPYEFPSLHGIGFTLEGRILAHHLSETISKTLYAASLDDTRPHLNGICFEFYSESNKESSNSLLRSITLDSHRLATVTRPCSAPSNSEQVLVPRRGLVELRRILDEDPISEVEFDAIKSFFVVRARHVELAIRLTDGQFPKYQKLFHPTPGPVIQVEGREILKALRRVSLFTVDSWKCVRFDVYPGKLRLSTWSREIGEANEELSIEYDDKPFSVGYNVKLLLEIINSLGEDQAICMELYHGTFPGKFFGAADPAAFGVLMPMRLEREENQE